jgi:hypothetical protein
MVKDGSCARTVMSTLSKIDFPVPRLFRLETDARAHEKVNYNTK